MAMFNHNNNAIAQSVITHRLNVFVVFPFLPLDSLVDFNTFNVKSHYCGSSCRSKGRH